MMFEPQDKARIFGLPGGVDFPAALVAGLMERTPHLRPEQLARVEIFTNTARMQRQIRAAFDQGPALLLPRVRLVTDLGADAALADVPPAVPGLRRRLELSQLVALLLEREPGLAPRAAIYELADSLTLLMAEMYDEDVSPATIRNMEVPDESGHWQRSLKFLQIVEQFFGDDSGEAPLAEARQRIVIERLVGSWQHNPPQHPVLIAGSTGSRGTTALLMHAVARLPQGALILPGFDFDQPDAVWARLDPKQAMDDHPQFRYAQLMEALDLRPGDIHAWASAPAPCPARNRLVSLALRPAPVTDQWLIEGPGFKDIDAAINGISLIEAPSARAEAMAIALALRQAADQGKTAALISPDRMLTRQVTAALDRWSIEPDDSAGTPLAQTAPGRLLRHIAQLFGNRLTSETLLALLKHPLVAAGSELRGYHLLWTRELEIWLRRRGPAFPDPDTMAQWLTYCAKKQKPDDGRAAWLAWFTPLIFGFEDTPTRALTDHIRQHILLARALTSGPDSEDDSELWAKSAGRETARVTAQLQQEAPYGGEMSPRDYTDLFQAVLSRGESRDPTLPHPNIMIWGTLEARVQGADLVILGGLNDGIWPTLPAPDPWLSRSMRKACGLALPEKNVGLSAHDFQQAIGARQVILSRAIRDAEAQTVSSRWLNRLCNLLDGMSEEGSAALSAMRARGGQWLALVSELETPAALVPPAPRPAPKPPLEARPRQLSVTEIDKLIRDPYAVYARHVLRLSALPPLRKSPDAMVRGTVIHDIFERFVKEMQDEPLEDARARLLEIATQVLAQQVPWPASRRIWYAKLAKTADWFIITETARRAIAAPSPEGLEVKGRLHLSDMDFSLTCKADRIDETRGGDWVIYDYKTGNPPTLKQMDEYQKQLLLEAVMAEDGAFEGLPPRPVHKIAYIGLGSKPKMVERPLLPGDTRKILDEFKQLIAHYQDIENGYTSRRAMEKMAYAYDFDHLARFGEWDESHAATPVKVGQ
jgi:ATP-dependent helicase/nuclease subunit B